MFALNYISEVKKLLTRIEDTQLDKIKEAGKIFARVIEEDRLIHVMGTGHSHMIAEELFVRAGGIAPVNAILDENIILTAGARKSSKLEKLEGLAGIIWEEYEIKKDDVMLIVSNSGRNSVPIEMALRAKEEGLYLMAITSLDHSKNSKSRHSSGKKLYQIADLVFDNCVPEGDSLLEFNGVKSGPASTIAGVLIVNSIVAEALELLSKKGIPLPVYGSQNVDGYDNESLFKKYEKRIKYL
jgi:uncharacterized phosphosugar-binding protein